MRYVTSHAQRRSYETSHSKILSPDKKWAFNPQRTSYAGSPAIRKMIRSKVDITG